MHGFSGRVLHVDLTTGRSVHHDLEESRLRQHLGGIGLGVSLELPLDRVRGVVVPVALAADLIPLKEWADVPVVGIHVYRASIVLKHGDEVVLERDLFRLDSAPGPPWRHFFRPLTRRSAPVSVCVVRKPADCAGRFWLRLFEGGWDTRRVPNGRYALALTVEGVRGTRATRTLRFSVAN